MDPEMRERGQRHDRWASLAVIGVFVLALILGWIVKVSAERQTVAYETDGLHLYYPANWVRLDVQPPMLLQVEDRWANPFHTTLTLERRLVMPDVDNTLDFLEKVKALDRGRNWTAYRMLGMEKNVSIGGSTGIRVTFAYVETNVDPFVETAPVVVYGEDYMLPMGNQVYIATLTADEAHYSQGQKAMQALLRSLEVVE